MPRVKIQLITTQYLKELMLGKYAQRCNSRNFTADKGCALAAKQHITGAHVPGREMLLRAALPVVRELRIDALASFQTLHLEMGYHGAGIG